MRGTLWRGLTANVFGFRQGSTGIHDGASQVILEAEFGTNDVDKCIGYILERGEIQETEVRIYNDFR